MYKLFLRETFSPAEQFDRLDADLFVELVREAVKIDVANKIEALSQIKDRLGDRAVAEISKWFDMYGDKGEAFSLELFVLKGQSAMRGDFAQAGFDIKEDDAYLRLGKAFQVTKLDEQSMTLEERVITEYVELCFFKKHGVLAITPKRASDVIAELNLLGNSLIPLHLSEMQLLALKHSFDAKLKVVSMSMGKGDGSLRYKLETQQGIEYVGLLENMLHEYQGLHLILDGGGRSFTLSVTTSGKISTRARLGMEVLDSIIATVSGTYRSTDDFLVSERLNKGLQRSYQEMYPDRVAGYMIQTVYSEIVSFAKVASPNMELIRESDKRLLVIIVLNRIRVLLNRLLSLPDQEVSHKLYATEYKNLILAIRFFGKEIGQVLTDAHVGTILSEVHGWLNSVNSIGDLLTFSFEESTGESA